ncbi:hypothetical protein C8A00DRAFT_30780 [Chaetomidium leptoderma]|uniref:C2H2-type domain-containing protein n=1 Tax=Chaetomidium leptoderma TaxID=669021 RepID=A0AAN6VT41_9PEZI|nr:hypothetical protein C8A00DRAFT_30780 [Chaetomidium leptoderma]
MAFTDLSMCNLNISLDLGDEVDFSFGSLPAGNSGSISGSSSASSSFGPHTPTSERSTPPFSTSFDFGSSFASSVDAVPFDLTPPSSATSTYFPMTPETGNVSGFGYPVFPATPSRGPFDFSGHPLSSCGMQLTPSQNTDCSFLAHLFGPHPLPSTPSVLTQFDHTSDTASHWMYPDSPISFEQQQSPTRFVGTVRSNKQDSIEHDWIKQELEDDMMPPSTPSDMARKRVLMGQVRHRTTALQQQVQQCQSFSAPRRIKVEKRARAVATESRSIAVDKVEPASTFRCPVEGCKVKPYRRNEHMKRHIQTVHQKSLHRCQFCKHTANRKDNWVAHLKLHTLSRLKTGGSKPRVDFYPAAVLLYEEEMKKNAFRRRRDTKTKKRSDSAA